MILHVLDEAFAYKGRIENFRTLKWKEQYQGKGSINLIVDDTAQNAAMLQRGRILLRGDRKTAMLIVKITRSSAEKTIHVYGHTTLALLDRRVICGKYTVTNAAEGIHQMYADNRRDLPILSGTAIETEDLEAEEEIVDTEMLNTFFSLCEAADIGLRVVCSYADKTQTLQTYQGNDLSYKDGQGGMIFSVEFGNMLSVTIDEDDSLRRNICYVRGVKTDESEVLLEVGEAGDDDRREMIIQGSIQTDEQTDEEYTAQLTKEGKDALQEYYDVTNFTAEISPEKLGKAFDLGDLVTCNATRYGVRFNAHLTEFSEEIEQGFRRVYITMGKPTITYAKAILSQAKK